MALSLDEHSGLALVDCAALASTGVDHLYSVSAITDSSGAVVERYKYNAYGERVVYDASGG